MDAHSPGERWLHRLALGFGPVAELSFDIERARHGKAARAFDCPRPVFVCGLARSGSSALVRALEAQGGFACLTYRDMPFPLAPISWARLSGGKARQVAAQARGHGDGLTHDLDTPEAIEEVFWKCHEGDRYIRRDHLADTPPLGDTMAAFRDYVRLVLLRAGAGRYLSKNNNNVLRVPALAAAFPDALLVHPFRKPEQHVASLMAVHESACEAHAKDPYRRRYMQWLAHHEFGSDHRPFAFGSGRTAGDAAQADHWLKQWIMLYRHLLDQPGPVRQCQIFADMDDCAAHGGSASTLLGRIADVPPEGPPAFRVGRERTLVGASAALLSEAEAVHADLCARAVASRLGANPDG